MWREVCPGQYHYQITCDALVTAFLGAFVLRLSGLRDVVDRLGRTLKTSNFSSLSHALSRGCSLAFVRKLIQGLQADHRPRRDELVVIDSMAVTLPSTQRHRCKKYNNKTVGGGVIWAYRVRAAADCCPVRVLKVVAGAWHDSKEMIGVDLIADGPIYLMDRGFYALGLIQSWMERRVRFIVRARRDAVSDVLRILSRPRAYGAGGWIERDAWVRLGSAGARAHPSARMIRARIGKQTLVLVSSERRWTAERILDAYKKRARIEQFHR